MTHAEGTSLQTGRLPAGFFPSDCPGQLISIGRYPDRFLEGDLVRQRMVTVWRCVQCEGRICVDHDAQRILNHYQGPRLSPDTVLGLAMASGNGGAS